MTDDRTPMMRQYHDLKRRYPGVLLAFRLGDFYEFFYDDAQVAARALGLTLTSRPVQKGTRIPMAGIPHHAVAGYLKRLLEQGHRVAICEQVEDARKARGLVRREVVRVVTPGTIVEETMLPAREQTFLVALCPHGARWGLAAADISTGALRVTEVEGPPVRVAEEVGRLAPRELLLPEPVANDLPAPLREMGVPATPYEEWRFDPEAGRRTLLDHLGVAGLEGYGIEGMPAAVGAAGALLHYLRETQRSALVHLRDLRAYRADEGLIIDDTARRTLEVVRNQRDGGVRGTLLEALDETLTPMGGRMLREWLVRPLADADAINARLDAVEDLVRDQPRRGAIRTVLRQIGDVERLVGRIGHGSATPRDLVALRASLEQIPALAEAMDGVRADRLAATREALRGHGEVTDLIARAIVDRPPLALTEGGIIREGYDAELDEVSRGASSARAWIAGLEARERARTGIKSLRVGFNKVFGYYIEVTRANLAQVPSDYERRQTLTGAERFITPELKEQEALVLRAEERIGQMEYELFCRVRDEVAAQAAEVQRTARAVAKADVFAALAEVADAWRYSRPCVTAAPTLEIREGRHPVVERALEGARFVPNDLVMTPEGRVIQIVTGPNWSGKSTFIRQAALIALMAQAGSFVPAASATVGLADRIFTRIGAAEDLVGGRSTFLTEMQEVASILHNATLRSLIILDEVGRGTATYDGMSIAWAVVQYLHHRLGARTLFATHYHELTELATLLPNVCNLNVLVREEGDHLVWLRRVVDGAADRSYGIQVARLAGVPGPVIDHAMRILRRLEAASGTAPLADESLPIPIPGRARGAIQLPLPLTAPSPVEEELVRLDIASMSPLDALNLLHRLRETAVGRRSEQVPPAEAEPADWEARQEGDIPPGEARGGKVVRLRRRRRQGE
ncbi:MAG: DNA mismatch repair protein MutS [Armatimonadetes bacterium]|nr:DNA mismatch repair protein MutS [Armatimonadota bacterium]